MSTIFDRERREKSGTPRREWGGVKLKYRFFACGFAARENSSRAKKSRQLRRLKQELRARSMSAMLSTLYADFTFELLIQNGPGRYIGRVSVDMSTDISVECRSIYRPIHRSRGAQNTHDPNSLTSQLK